MKLTSTQLRRIIREEVQLASKRSTRRRLREAGEVDPKQLLSALSVALEDVDGGMQLEVQYVQPLWVALDKGALDKVHSLLSALSVALEDVDGGMELEVDYVQPLSRALRGM